MKEAVLQFLNLLIVFGDIANAFVCQKQGVFANPDASDCGSYILCYSNLQFDTRYCPVNTYFWPLNKGCYSYYNCAINSTPDSDNTNPCNGFSDGSLNTILDKYSIDCSSYIDCKIEHKMYGSVWNGIRNQCPSGTGYKHRTGCVSNYKCTNYQCKAEGYFPNPNVTDCSSFVICDKYSTGSGSFFYSYVEICPPNTKFSPFLRKCDAFYNCDGNDPYKGIDPCLNYYWASPFVANPLTNDFSIIVTTVDRLYYSKRDEHFPHVVGICHQGELLRHKRSYKRHNKVVQLLGNELSESKLTVK